MQQQLVKAQEERKLRKQRQNDSNIEISQIHYVRSSDVYAESDDGTMADTTLDLEDYDDYYEEEVMEDEVEPVMSYAAATRQAPAAPPVAVRPNLMASLAAAATERTQRLEQNGGEPVMMRQAPAPIVKESPAKPNWLAAMAVAATERVQRLEETGGALIMAEHEPEVAAPRHITPQLSTSMAEMVAKKAADRDRRLEEGGEKKMTAVKEEEKEEYKETLSNIFNDAAKLGKLTRMNEHCVEAVAGQKIAVKEWTSKGLLAIQWHDGRSKHMSVIHEAAAAGNAAKLPETIVSNAPEEQRDYDYENMDIEQPLSPRMLQLLELNTRCGTGQNKVDHVVMGRQEDKGKHLLVKPMHCYSSIDEVILPKKRPPKVNPEKARQMYLSRLKAANAEHRPLTSISNDVATLAWERRSRLDRPGQVPRVKQVCPCPYCFDASPFQTFAYRVKDELRKTEDYESSDSDEEQEQKLQDQRKAGHRERQAARTAAQPLSIREAREALGETIPVRMRVKAINTPPPSASTKPDESPVVARNYQSQELVATPPPPPRVVPSQPTYQKLEEEIKEMEAAIYAQQVASISPPDLPTQEAREPMSVASIPPLVVSRPKLEASGSLRMLRDSQSVVSKSPSVVSRPRLETSGSVRMPPRGPMSVTSKTSRSPSEVSRPKLETSGSVRMPPRRPKSVATKSPSVARSGRRKPATNEPAPPVPSSVEVTTTVEVKAPPKMVKQPSKLFRSRKRRPAAKEPAPPVPSDVEVNIVEVKAPPKVATRPKSLARQPSRKTVPDKSVACSIM
jgi:hypothetical protein